MVAADWHRGIKVKKTLTQVLDDYKAELLRLAADRVEDFLAVEIIAEEARDNLLERYEEEK